MTNRIERETYKPMRAAEATSGTEYWVRCGSCHKPGTGGKTEKKEERSIGVR